MTRREPRHFLALPVLLATLMCVALPAPVLAKQGNGNGKSQRDDSGYQESRGKREASVDGRDGGDKSGRGQSNQKSQRSDDNNGKSRGDNSGHGRSDDNRHSSDDRNNSGRKSQQSQSLSPQQAAQRARSQYGGQVLKVQPAGGGYQVRLLQDDGRVVTVPIGD